MTISVIGINYQTTPLSLRERLYLTGDDLRRALTSLHTQTDAEVVIVSTCNRLEIYTSASDDRATTARVMAHLVGQSLLPPAELQQHIQTATDREAVQHLMRVAAGLESLVLGESEVLGQVGDALQEAQAAQTIGPVLSRLFHTAVHVGKRARTETAISQHTLSVSHAAVLMAQRQLPELISVNSLVIGAGRMAELAARALKARGVQSVRVVNRTFARASDLANRIGIEAVAWEHLPAVLAEVDVIITATSAPRPILTPENIPASRCDNEDRALILIDIAVPRNVDEKVRGLPNVQLYDIDDLQGVVEDHRTMRQSEAAQVETIIAEEWETYLAWLNSRSAVSTIVELREKAEALAEAELSRTLSRLPELREHEREVVTQMAYRLVNKLLHAPTTTLRERAGQGDHFIYLHAVRQLFDLEAQDE